MCVCIFTTCIPHHLSRYTASHRCPLLSKNIGHVRDLCTFPPPLLLMATRLSRHSYRNHNDYHLIEPSVGTFTSALPCHQKTFSKAQSAKACSRHTQPPHDAAHAAALQPFWPAAATSVSHARVCRPCDFAEIREEWRGRSVACGRCSHARHALDVRWI